jgi:hypothetical protein
VVLLQSHQLAARHVQLADAQAVGQAALDAVLAGRERDAPIAVGSIPEQKPLIRESHDRLVELAKSEGARLLPGHCPRTWPALETSPVVL